jgi:reverse transcriptase-like protein
VPYTTFELTTGGKRRLIEVPDPVLKRHQRALLRRCPRSFISPFSYGVSRGVHRAVTAHLGATAVLRIDIANFFPSISEAMLNTNDRVRSLAAACEMPWNEFADLVLYHDNGIRRLPQGAPTSPLVADVALTDFDYRVAHDLSSIASALALPSSRIAYTRYVDDVIVTASWSDRVGCEKFIARAVDSISQQVAAVGLNVRVEKTRKWTATRCPTLLCLGYSLWGSELQVARRLREKARRILWKIARGSSLSRKERGILSYVCTGRIRIPRNVASLLRLRTDPDARLVKALVAKQRAVARDESLSIKSLLADGKITINEASRPASRGQLQELLDQGETKFRWSTAHAWKTCNWCEMLDRQTFEIQDVIGRSNKGLRMEDWIAGVLPAHPRCRCVAVSVET